MIRFLVVAAVLTLVPAALPAQTSSAPHSGGFSPFRGRGFAGSGGEVGVGVKQEGCPLDVDVTAMRRDERGVVLTVRLENLGEHSVTTVTLVALAFAADGTPRAAQRQKVTLRLEPRAHGSADIVVRGVERTPIDVVAVGVQEVGGAAAWKVDGRELERHARRTLWP